MIVTQRASQKADAFAMGIVQIGVIGACGMACAVVFETPALPAAPLDWAAMAVLVVVCSGFGFVLQPVAQKPLPSEEASLMCAINPFVATVLGVVVLGEQIAPLGMLGLVFILAAIVLGCMPAKARGTYNDRGSIETRCEAVVSYLKADSKAGGSKAIA